MLVLKLVGELALIAASVALGIRLLLLWRRTRELPELSIGTALVFGGGLSFVAWVVLAVAYQRGAALTTLHAITVVGLACLAICNVALCWGVAAIFRPGVRLAKVASLLVTLVSVVCWVGYAGLLAENPSPLFWSVVLLIAPVFLWAAVESLVLARVLHRRAKLGLADPVIVSRAAQWGLSSLCIVVSVVLSFGARLAGGPVLPDWVGIATSLLGLIAATMLWLGFFPPRAFRTRIDAAYGR